MPELPEVETTKEGLKKDLEGQKILKIQISKKKLRFPYHKNFMMLKETFNEKSFVKENNIKLICGDGENIPLPDNSIDIITLSFGVRNMTDRLKCLYAVSYTHLTLPTSVTV